MPATSGDKLCPICDSPLQPGSKKCSFCGTDLSIFDIDLETPKKAPEPAPSAPPKPSFEARVEEVLSRPQSREAASAVRETPHVAPPVVEQPKPQPPAPGPKIEAPVEQEPAPEPTQEVMAEPQAQIEYFECPQCGNLVETTATSCPKCGVLFSEEGTDVFECPACNTLVSIDAKSCPGCGAVFVESEEEAAAAQSESVSSKDLEPPLAEVKAPPKPEKPAPPEKKAEAPPEKKGFFSMFKRGKKEEKPPDEEEAEKEEEKPVVQKKPEPAAPAAKPLPPPRPAEVKIREAAPPARHLPAPSVSPAAKDKGKELARMVAEMKPLLALAREKEVEIGESKQLIDDAAIAGRERQIDKAIDLVQKSKSVLMGKMDSHLGQMITRLNDEIKVAREFGGDISRASTYIQEVARARASGDVEAAYVYVDKVAKELLPITGRYNESRQRLSNLKELIADCEVFIVDTKDARRLLVDATRAFDSKDFDKVESLIKSARDSLYKGIPQRMNEEMKKARDELYEAKKRDVNITPMLTVLKSSTSLMKSGEYGQALREMREFKELMKKAK